MSLENAGVPGPARGGRTPAGRSRDDVVRLGRHTARRLVDGAIAAGREDGEQEPRSGNAGAKGLLLRVADGFHDANLSPTLAAVVLDVIPDVERAIARHDGCSVACAVCGRRLPSAVTFILGRATARVKG